MAVQADVIRNGDERGHATAPTAEQGEGAGVERLEPDALVVAGRTLRSRLIMGTSRYPNPQVMLDALRASGAELVTVAIRRVNLQDQGEESFLDLLLSGGFRLLPNTAGCYTAREAVLVAQLAREALETNLIKLEVIGDDETLLPDVEQLLKAAKALVDDGFQVMAYSNDDPITCRKLADLGCEAVMPLASPIGSGQGLVNPYNLQLIRELVPETPLIVDAGIGTASDACRAMELGYDGILLNTAVSEAQHPVMMAGAMRHAVEAGRAAFVAGRIPRRFYAKPSTPHEGRIDVASKPNEGRTDAASSSNEGRIDAASSSNEGRIDVADGG